MDVEGGVVVQMADVAVVQVAVDAVVDVAGHTVVEVAGGAVVEVACGGAGGQPAEAAVLGQWACNAWGLSFCCFRK
jgi:hypothetical protein